MNVSIRLLKDYRCWAYDDAPVVPAGTALIVWRSSLTSWPTGTPCYVHERPDSRNWLIPTDIVEEIKEVVL